MKGGLLRTPAEPEGLASRIRSSYYWRRSRASIGEEGGHKEWQHFCVFAPTVDLMVNLSLMDGVQAGRGEPAFEIGRVAVLVRDGEGWDGDVVRCTPPETRVRGGEIDCRFGANRLRWIHGGYELSIDLPERGIAASLRFEPLVTPAMTNSVPLGRGGSVKWLVVPHLVASGHVQLGERRHVLARAPAYHDHNWGTFHWGDDFSWEWAVVLPPHESVPWTLVFTRLSDRPQHRVFSEGLLLWRGDTHWRTFRGSDLEVSLGGFLRRRRPLRIPRVMWLAAPGEALDVPAEIRVEGRNGADELDLELQIDDLGQIAIPSDADPESTTLLAEALARGRVRGRVRDEDVDLEGPAIVELVRVAH